MSPKAKAIYREAWDKLCHAFSEAEARKILREAITAAETGTKRTRET